MLAGRMLDVHTKYMVAAMVGNRRPFSRREAWIGAHQAVDVRLARIGNRKHLLHVLQRYGWQILDADVAIELTACRMHEVGEKRGFVRVVTDHQRDRRLQLRTECRHRRHRQDLVIDRRVKMATEQRELLVVLGELLGSQSTHSFDLARLGTNHGLRKLDAGVFGW